MHTLYDAGSQPVAISRCTQQSTMMKITPKLQKQKISENNNMTTTFSFFKAAVTAAGIATNVTVARSVCLYETRAS